jgi:lipoprotein-releasing system ATP-binding protein
VASPVIIKGQSLFKVYSPNTPLELQVLAGVDIEVRAGEFVAVVGQSGSGKSTLLNLMGALDTPTSGSLNLGGLELAGLGSDALADVRSTRIGFVFQFHYLLDEFSCLENALMPILVRSGRASPAQQERVRQLMDRVGLSDQMHKLPSKISGGQQQRVAIVRALANQPSLVLADEPTGNLDSRSGQQVFALMREITRDHQVAFVMVTHDDRLARAADRILRIEDGLIREVTHSDLV